MYEQTKFLQAGASTAPDSSSVRSTVHHLQRGYGDTFYIDEVLVKINGKQHYLWRAVDKDGEVVDVYLQTKRDGAAAKGFSGDCCEIMAANPGGHAAVSYSVIPGLVIC